MDRIWALYQACFFLQDLLVKVGRIDGFFSAGLTSFLRMGGLSYKIL